MLTDWVLAVVNSLALTLLEAVPGGVPGSNSGVRVPAISGTGSPLTRASTSSSTIPGMVAEARRICLGGVEMKTRKISET